MDKVSNSQALLNENRLEPLLNVFFIVTKEGIYNEIYTKPKGISEGEAQGISQGLRLYFIVFPDLSHNTDILNNNSSIDLPIGRVDSLYCSVSPSRLSNTEELKFQY